MYTSKERVIRDGYLIAFEGEVMSDEEAAKRGLLDPEPEQKPKAKNTRRKAKPKAEPVEDEEDYDEDEEA
ncbi:hypothetical protein [Adlercreutzia sp.]|uniref:hypothetical protein n=1 Tax=Adlercreutzia sp. TaxID=1872387 RepID=UPI002E7A96FE|nr:hypothetical protein [Adlercreutzia sp.]MEE0635636.1 hypothetical protein [Adlercreutzia sp.]